MKPRFKVLVLGSGFFAALGCANIIGLSDYKVTDTPATGGSSGTGGVTGSGGSTTGSGGQNNGVIYGCDGSTPLNINLDIVRSCAFYASCNPFVPDFTLSQCVTQNILSSFTGRSCASHATKCEDVQRCDGFGFAPAGMCKNNTDVFCSDSKIVSCKVGGSIDCAVLGASCLQVGNSAGCKVKDSCSETDSDYHCDGDLLYKCVGGIASGQDCSKVGSRCETRGGRTACYYDTPSCTGSVAACRGSFAERCIDQHLYRNDCGAAGLGCDSSGAAVCLAPGCTSASISGCKETCTGDLLGFCYGGVKVSLRCKELGFNTCAIQRDPNVGDYARCVY